MKKRQEHRLRSSKKLSLSQDTLARLSQTQLERVAGGHVGVKGATGGEDHYTCLCTVFPNCFPITTTIR